MQTALLRKHFITAEWVVTVLIGIAAHRQWRGRVIATEERLAESERAREAVAERVAIEERLRIARDLHDSLTHNISVVKVQSGVAAHLARKRGEEVDPAIQAIQEAAGDAARELRETLGVLRRDGESTTGRGLAEVPELVERARAVHLAVDLETTGEERDVPREVDAAAYRIVQEALTNVCRHSGATRATVRVTYERDRLVVQVDDNGVGQDGPPSGSGLGLIGMRERVSALGGQLVAQGRPGGGFTVRAELPAVVAAPA